MILVGKLFLKPAEVSIQHMVPRPDKGLSLCVLYFTFNSKKFQKSAIGSWNKISPKACI